MKDKERVPYYSFLAAAACFLSCAVVDCFSDESKAMAVTHFCLAASFFSLSLTHKSNRKKNG